MPNLKAEHLSASYAQEPLLPSEYRIMTFSFDADGGLDAVGSIPSFNEVAAISRGRQLSTEFHGVAVVEALSDGSIMVLAQFGRTPDDIAGARFLANGQIGRRRS